MRFDRAETVCLRPTGKFHKVRWPLNAGRGRFGEFPLVVVREHFRACGYTVWASEPELPNDAGFILVAYPGKRSKDHPAYRRMEAMFSKARLRDLNLEADEAKRSWTQGVGGGDPDLFVFGGDEKFFVEVKWKDSITQKQHATFPIIEQHCAAEIKIARLRIVK